MKQTLKTIALAGLLLIPLSALAEIKPYKTLNAICVAEKNGNGYSFFKNRSEMRARSSEIFGETTRDNFEWFYVSKKDPQDLYYQIQAKVYPQMRDALIDAPNTEMKATIDACALTSDNQRLAETVTYQYKSKDRICVCLRENGKIKCAINENTLNNAPIEKWVPFFESGGYPSVIIGVVPRVVFKATLDVPDLYMQELSPCGYNTSNEDFINQNAQALHAQAH